METPWVLVTRKEVKNCFEKPVKRGKLKYAKCKVGKCEEEVLISNLGSILRYYREHLLIHKIRDKDYTIPEGRWEDFEDLLNSAYKAKCKKCGIEVSYLTTRAHLKQHLNNKHSASITVSSQHEPSTSSSMDYDVDTSTERQIQERPDSSVSLSKQQLKNFMNLSAESEEPLDLSLRSCGQRRKETRALDQPSTSSSMNDFMDPYADYQKPSLQSCKKSRKETAPLDKSVPSTSTSSVALANFDPVVSEKQSWTLSPYQELQGSPKQAKIQEDTVDNNVADSDKIILTSTRPDTHKRKKDEADTDDE